MTSNTTLTFYCREASVSRIGSISSVFVQSAHDPGFISVFVK